MQIERLGLPTETHDDLSAEEVMRNTHQPMTASPCDRCGARTDVQPVQVMGDYHGRGMWSQWIEVLCSECADRARKANEWRETNEWRRGNG